MLLGATGPDAGEQVVGIWKLQAPAVQQAASMHFQTKLCLSYAAPVGRYSHAAPSCPSESSTKE
eukprot:1157724-Pelagomonas_calceolata.AAC.5